jgi:hypothetical protein
MGIKKHPIRGALSRYFVFLYYRCFEKQSLQKTGRPSRGLKGTVVCLPQEAQVTGTGASCDRSF